MENTDSQWQQLAALKPQLRNHVRIHRHVYLRQVWYVAQDAISGRFHRFTPSARYLLGLMNGARTVDEIHAQGIEFLCDVAPSREEVLRLMTMLTQTDLVLFDHAPDHAALNERARTQAKLKQLSYWRNPLALRLRLWDPDRFLTATLPLVRPLFSRAALLAWAMLIAFGLVQAAANWSELTANGVDQLLSLENLVLIALLFPFIKSIHELAHGYATKVFGGEVHEFGVMFLVFFPIPYVDATSANGFREKRKRIVTGAVGMMAELVIAVACLMLWLAVEPGIVRTLAFNAMLIAGVSTLFFNGNPLLKFDAYYILMDALEIPNLASRSQRYLGYLVRRYAFGTDVQSPANATCERRWFVFYAIGSFCYRMFMLTFIAIMVSRDYLFVGVLLALWVLYFAVLAPAARLLWQGLTAPELSVHRVRGVALIVALLVTIIGLPLAVPVPYGTVAEGVVWVPEESWVRAAEDGYIDKFFVEQNAEVAAGQILVRMSDATAATRLAVAQARYDEVNARLRAAVATNRSLLAQVQAELSIAAEKLADTEERVANLVVRTMSHGKFLSAENLDDLQGRFVRRGTPIGYILDDDIPTIRVIVAAEDVDLVRNATNGIAVRFADDFGTQRTGKILRQIPLGARDLPSTALGLEGGGEIAVALNEETGRVTVKPWFQFDVGLDAPIESVNLGMRAYVRFDHDNEPLALRMFREIRQTFLRQLDM